MNATYPLYQLMALVCSITALLVPGTGEAAGIDLQGEHIQPTLKFSESGSGEELTVEQFHVRYQFTHLFAEPIIRFNCRWDKASSGRLRPYDYSRLDRHEGAADYVKRRMTNNFSSFSEVGEAVPWDKAGISWGSRFSARVSYRNSRQNIYVLFMCDSIRGPEKPGFGPSMAGSPKWSETFYRDRAGTVLVGENEAKEIFRSLYGITDVKANKGEVDLSEISSFRDNLIHEAREKFPRQKKQKEEDEDTLADELEDALDEAEDEVKGGEKAEKENNSILGGNENGLDLDTLLASAEDEAVQKKKGRQSAARKKTKLQNPKKIGGTKASTTTSKHRNTSSLSSNDQMLINLGEALVNCTDCTNRIVLPFQLFDGRPGYLVDGKNGQLGVFLIQKNGTAKYIGVKKLPELESTNKYFRLKIFGGDNSIYLSFGDAFVQKFSLDGEILWTNSQDNNPHFDLAVLPDGGILYLNEAVISVGGSYDNVYSVGKVLPDGTSDKSRRILSHVERSVGYNDDVYLPRSGDGQFISLNRNGSFLVSVPGGYYTSSSAPKPVMWVHHIDKDLKILSSKKSSAPVVFTINKINEVPRSRKPTVRRGPQSNLPIIQVFNTRFYVFDSNGERLGVYPLPEERPNYSPQRFNHSNGFVLCAFPDIYNISYTGVVLGKIEPINGRAVSCSHANDNSVLVRDLLVKQEKDSTGKVSKVYVPAKNFRLIKLPNSGG